MVENLEKVDNLKYKIKIICNPILRRVYLFLYLAYFFSVFFKCAVYFLPFLIIVRFTAYSFRILFYLQIMNLVYFCYRSTNL